MNTTTSSNTIIRNEELVNNPNPRISICLCLDTSSSMIGAPITELNKGIQLFYDSIKKDPIASGVAEIAIVTFGAQGVKSRADFTNILSVKTAPAFFAGGFTPMGEALNLAIDKLVHRQCEYRARGVEYYKPWLILMSDGQSNGSKRELNRARQRIASQTSQGELDFLPIGIGDTVNMNELASFSPHHEPYKLYGLRFQEFFSWLSRSVSRVSCSMPGQDSSIIALPTADWSTL